MNYLNHTNDDSNQSQRVEDQLGYKNLGNGNGLVILSVDQYEEEDHADYCHDQNKDAEEKPFVGIGAVHWIVMRWTTRGRDYPIGGVGRLRGAGVVTGVSPYGIHDGGADKTILDGARKEERTGVLR